MTLEDAGSFVLEEDVVEHLDGTFAVTWDLGGCVSQFDKRVDISPYVMVFFVAFQRLEVVFTHHVDLAQTIKVLSLAKFDQLKIHLYCIFVLLQVFVIPGEFLEKQ